MTDERLFQIDALVAQMVMGWYTFRSIQEQIDCLEYTYPYAVPGVHDGNRVLLLYSDPDTVVPFQPSTDVCDALTVFMSFGAVYKYLSHGPRRSLGWTIGQPFEWTCGIYAMNSYTHETLPMAICQAAIAAAEIRERNKELLSS